MLACGCFPPRALNHSDNGEARFLKILAMITGCDLSNQDLSRVEPDAGSGLPRFNMPLELGADLALLARARREQG